MPTDSQHNLLDGIKKDNWLMVNSRMHQLARHKNSTCQSHTVTTDANICCWQVAKGW